MDSLLDILLLLSPSIIYFSARKPIKTNYKLRKDFKLKGVKTAVLPNEVLRKVSDIDEAKILEQQFGSSIIEFINIIKQNIPDSDLTLFYNNLNNIKTSVKDFKISNLILGEHTGAQWLPLENIIELSASNYKSTINHELLHVATTYIDQKTKTVLSGFQQIKNENNQIGEGLNEGYTQYLTEKYFSHTDILKAYPYEKRIAETVELIVGQEKMQSLYFNANLNGLIETLKQYNTEENVYDFITTLDFLSKHSTDKKLTSNSEQIIINCLKSINSFLIKTYIKKTILEHPDKDIEIKEVLEKLIPLLTKIPSSIKINGKSINLTDQDLMMEIIDDALSSFEKSEDRKTISK